MPHIFWLVIFIDGFGLHTQLSFTKELDALTFASAMTIPVTIKTIVIK